MHEFVTIDRYASPHTSLLIRAGKLEAVDTRHEFRFPLDGETIFARFRSMMRSGSAQGIARRMDLDNFSFFFFQINSTNRAQWMRDVGENFEFSVSIRIGELDKLYGCIVTNIETNIYTIR